MTINVIYFLFLYILLVQKVNGYEPKDEHVESRIVGGTPVNDLENPWYAVIAIQKKNTLALCGGSLISRQWVLTSAQCIDEAEVFSIGIGKVDLDDYETNNLIVSTEGIKHEKYDKNTLNHDIGLIKLPKLLVFSDRVNATRLPSRNLTKQNLDDMYVNIAGHGRNENDDISNNLTNVLAETITLRRCKDYYGQETINLYLICATAATDMGPCYNDTGNPLIYYEADGYATQIGIFSYFHAEGCDLGYPSVYTRVGRYIDWIYNKTGVRIVENSDDGSSLVQVSNVAIGFTLITLIKNVF